MKTKKQINVTIDKDLFNKISKEDKNLSTTINNIVEKYYKEIKKSDEILELKTKISEIQNELIEMKKQNNLTENFVRQTVNYSQANLIVLSDNSEKAKKFLSDIKQKYENN
jgi:L-lactate utilization protein LutC